MNKYTLAAVAFIVALFAGVGPALSGGSLTAATIMAAVSAAGIAALGKIMDPNSIVSFPPLVTAFLLATASVVPMIGDAVTNGTITNAAVWGGILVAFLNTLWAKWSVPNKAFTFGHR